jgi:hypothetical protein
MLRSRPASRVTLAPSKLAAMLSWRLRFLLMRLEPPESRPRPLAKLLLVIDVVALKMV